MSFAPVAIVGQGCVLPGALTPASLWTLVREGRATIGPAPAGLWALHPRASRSALARAIASDAGGYVQGFGEVFSPDDFLIPVNRNLDPVFLWPLHAAREALRSARLDPRERRPRGAVVLGNLGYPTPGLARFAREVWTHGKSASDPRDRFMAGLPAQLVASALGFGGAAFALDAACASSLYAIKLACDRLHDGEVDIALAGGVNHADDLFLHLGFTALSALSPSGRSRPFDVGADGLLPAQGAAIVVLKRLEDAEAAGDPILGVIRAVGLSNDGRSRGLLVPSATGQARAMRAAYEAAGLSPRDVSLVECHATGTSVGDAIELASLAEVFEGARDVPLGSLKSNLGHLITASGAAALIKVLGALAARERPPSLGVEQPIEAVRPPFRVLRALEPWTSVGPRVAAISNFGFGGNNAHLVVEEWVGRTTTSASRGKVPAARVRVAVVARAVHAGAAASALEVDRAVLTGRTLIGGDPPGAAATTFELPLTGLRFPPADLEAAIPQQTLLMKTALALGTALDPLPRERTALLVGMQCDAEVARWGLRWRQAPSDDPEHLAPLGAAITVGCMPNVVANRLNQQLGLEGPSFTVFADEASGTVALDLAARALAHGEIDAALVGAVDLSCEPVARAARAAVFPDAPRAMGDGAVVLVMKRLDDARRDGDRVAAIIEPDAEGPAALELAVGRDAGAAALTPIFGHAHAAIGLLHVAAAIGACERRALPATRSPSEESQALPWLPGAEGRSARVRVAALGGMVTETRLTAADPPDAPFEARSPRLAVFAARGLGELSRALDRREPTEPAGDVRVAIVGADAGELEARVGRAAELLRARAARPAPGPLFEGVWFGEGPPPGEVAFVFTGPAGAYPRMGRGLALACPDLVDRLAARMGCLRDVAGWVYDGRGIGGGKARPIDKLWGSSFLIQLHAELTLGLLRMRPNASIGYCSGETNALFAFGAWSDLDGFRRAIDDLGVYTRELAGELGCVRRAWGLAGEARPSWTTLRVRAPVEDVRAALAGESRAHLTIVNGRADAIVAGEPAACARFSDRIGARRVTPLDYDFVMHCPEARVFAADWRRLHHRPTSPVPGVRFYTHATLASYVPTDDAVADALLGQAMSTVDFPALVERAYADGVRVFVEHGPHAGCTKWIAEALGSRAHLAVALDEYGRESLVQCAESVARLAAAGVPLDHRAFAARLAPEDAEPSRARGGPRLLLEAHPKPIHSMAASAPAPPREAIDEGVEIMAPAPPLPMRGLREARPTSEGVSVPHRPRRSAEAPSDPRARLAAVHIEYLRLQSEANARFLEVLAAASRSARREAHIVSPPVFAAPEPARELAIEPAFTEPAFTEPAFTEPMHAAPMRAEPMRAEPMRAEAIRTESMRAAPQGRPRPPRGPHFDRPTLERLASGSIADVFGPLFRVQDAYARQVRLPEPPLLLVDRVLGIDAEPGSMGRGTLWTETDVRDGAWYLHEGRMPAGILVESGQADLLLISWLGIDAHNRGERVYRLLGCDLVSHGELPRPGETLRYEIHVDGHARQGDVRLFFFHYDCFVGGELRLTVRNGQAGFFTDEELGASAGILWSAESATPTPGARVAPPAVVCDKRRLEAADIAAFIEGRVRACFGPGFERAETHTRTPMIQGGRMRLLDEVTALEPAGGPWRRGYLRARLALEASSWFFRGHFKNDPCMPGTLMFEGCLQAMAIYMTAMGYTLGRDGFRFEPVRDLKYELRCRGQAIPSSKEVVYEVFVDELLDGPVPTLYADVLGTVDGLKAFHCRRMGLALVPAWPIDPGRLAHPVTLAPRAVACAGAFAFDERAILACAWGRPSDAFGPMYTPFDGGRRVPRLPGPPYLFMSRVAAVDGPMGEMMVGTTAVVEYDVPSDAWYFEDGGANAMPFAVLLEVALQPCGWVSSYVGCTLTTDAELAFRNLDGTGTVRGHVDRAAGMLVTCARLASLSRAGALIIVGFEVVVKAGDRVVFELETVFGFFTQGAMREQNGLPTTDEDRAALATPCEAGALEALRAAGGGLLRMIDRVTGLWLDGGAAGLGRIRVKKTVRPSDWSFKAHFFRDPVQPGSLGMEAMIQAVCLLAREKAIARGLSDVRFEPIACDVALTWKYRGQVLPENELVVVDMTITRLVEETEGWLVVAHGSLWVDGKRIYSAKDLGVRLVGQRQAE